jgi:hypothetical protein
MLKTDPTGNVCLFLYVFFQQQEILGGGCPEKGNIRARFPPKYTFEYFFIIYNSCVGKKIELDNNSQNTKKKSILSFLRDHSPKNVLSVYSSFK